jgi:hypothetical protein
VIDRHELRRYLSDHPGHPLGPGMPLGATMRLDGESHRAAWERVIRADPCSYCDRRRGGSVDHVEPKNPLKPLRGLGSKYDWLNLAGACMRCNGSKSDRSLLAFLLLRA